MKVVSVAIQKGGAGKTTTTLNLGATLRDAGKKCQVFATRIRGSTALAEAQQAGNDALTFDKTLKGAADYRDLAAEFLAKSREP